MDPRARNRRAFRCVPRRYHLRGHLEYKLEYRAERDSKQKPNTPMNGNVKPHELNKASIVAKAKQCGEIVRVILLCVNRRKLAPTIDIAVNAARDVRQLRDARVSRIVLEHEGCPFQNSILQIHRVLEGRAPVLLLSDALGIGFGERGVVIKLRRHHT